jgi:hypothetical protein
MSLQLEYRNAVFKSADGLAGAIDCEINHPDYGWIEYTIDPNDTDDTVSNSHLTTQMEANDDVAAYVAPTWEEIDAANADKIRLRRNAMLANVVDPIVSNPLRWDGLTSEQQAEMRTYRDALLNVTEQETFPTSVTFPTLPSWAEPQL